MFKKSIATRVTAGALGIATAATCFGSAINLGTAEKASAASDSNYAEALALSLYFFDSNECGTEVDSNALTWRGNCHTYDAKASIANATNFPSQYQSLVDPDGDGYVDVSGGYHDAGDHVKFNLTNAFACSSLAMSYYLNDGAYDKAGCTAHLYEIVKKMSSYLMKTTFLDASGNVATICYNVSDSSDHNYWQAPEVQSYDRKTYWMSASNNNQSICGQMASALAGAYYMFKSSDASYASECLKYAKAIYNFGMNNSGNETAGMGDMYGTEKGVDELALASAWLYLDGAGSMPTYTTKGDGCYNGNYSELGDFYYYCWNKVWSGYATMMYKITGDSSYASEMKYELDRKGGVPTSSYNATDQGSWGASRYNCALQMLALGLAKGDSSSAYAQGAKYQMDYILGNNPTGYSFLIGYGSKWPTHIHHRAANPGNSSASVSADVTKENSTAKYTNYGMLVGGPSDSNGTYEDTTEKYQYTEPALDYNACFALACAGLVNTFGGDSSAINSLISSASEIDASHNFNGGSTPAVTTTTTAATKVTTTTTVAGGSESAGGVIDFKEDSTVGDDGTTYKFIEFSPGNPNAPGNYSKITVTYEVTSTDTESSGSFGTWTGSEWAQVDFKKVAVKDGKVSVTYDVPENVGATVKCSVYWPGESSVKFVSVVGESSSTPVASSTTKTTAKPTTTTKTTTTTTSPSQAGSDIKYTEATEKGDDGKIYKYIEFAPGNNKSISVTYKVKSSDTESTGSFGTWTGTWDEVKFKEDVKNGTVTVTYNVPSNVGSTVKCSVYWPGADSVEFVSVTGSSSAAPVVTTSTTKSGSSSSSGGYNVEYKKKITYSELPTSDKMIGFDWSDFGIGTDEKITGVDVNLSTGSKQIGKWQGAFGSSTKVAPDYWTQTKDMEQVISSKKGTISWEIDSATSDIIQTEYGGQLKVGFWWIDCDTFKIDSITVYTDKNPKGSAATSVTTTTTTSKTTAKTTTTTKKTTVATTTTTKTTTSSKPDYNATATKYGDVNVDGDVTIADAVLLNKYLVNSATLTDTQKANADCQFDSKVTSTDTLAILKYIVGTVDTLPIK